MMRKMQVRIRSMRIVSSDVPMTAPVLNPYFHRPIAILARAVLNCTKSGASNPQSACRSRFPILARAATCEKSLILSCKYQSPVRECPFPCPGCKSVYEAPCGPHTPFYAQSRRRSGSGLLGRRILGDELGELEPLLGHEGIARARTQ